MDGENREPEGFHDLVELLRAGRLPSRGPDWKTADGALSAAAAIENSRRERRRLELFLICAFAFLGAWVALGSSGHGSLILAFEAATFLLFPFVGLVALGGSRGARKA